MTAKRKPKAPARKPRRRPTKAKRAKVVKATECKTTHEMVDYQTKAPREVKQDVESVPPHDQTVTVTTTPVTSTVGGVHYIFSDQPLTPGLPPSLVEDLKPSVRKSWWTGFLDWLSEG